MAPEAAKPFLGTTDELVTSLQRELAEARERIASLTRFVPPPDAVIYARGLSSNPQPGDYYLAPNDAVHLATRMIDCSHVILKRWYAPGPSDAKGEGEPGDWQLSKANACIRGIGVALGIDQPHTKPFGLGLAILGAIESLKSRPSLTPLTDPTDVVGEWAMLRKFLVDVGDSLSVYDCNAGLAENLVRILAAVAKLKATADEPAQKLVPLPEGARVIVPHNETAPGFRIAYLDGWWQLVDPALYGVDAERVKELEAEIAKLNETIECGRVCNRELWSMKTAIKSEAERLRKAIETHQYNNTGMACEHKQSDRELWSAITPPTAASKLPDCVRRDTIPVQMPLMSEPSSAPAAASEGERKSVDPEQLFNEVVAALDHRVKARIAACEGRCKELEAGIKRHRTRRKAPSVHGITTADTDLWSLLAPKAEG